jgi:integrase
MATIFKRKGSPIYYAAYDVPQPDGTTRRLKKSTKKTKKGDAQVEADRLEALDLKSTSATGDKGAKAYAILSEAADAAARGELSEARGRLLLSRLVEISTGEALKFYTVRSWAEDWLSSKSETKPATQKRYKSSVNMFLAYFASKAEERLESITKSEIRKFRDDIRTGWSPEKKKKRGKRKSVKQPKDAPSPKRSTTTTNQVAADITGMFRAAVRDGVLLGSPCSGLGRLRAVDSHQREVFSIDEITKLIEAAGEPAWQQHIYSAKNPNHKARAAKSKDWQGMILLAFYVGPRLGDCARMKWKNVNLERNNIVFMPQKTDGKKKVLDVPLHQRLALWLQENANKDPESPVFPTLVNTSVSGKTGLSQQFVAIMNHAAVDRRTKRPSEEGRRAQHARGFHAIRHSLTSALANADVSEEVRRKIVGHESADVHAIYTHHEHETLARAIGKLPSV